MDSNIFVEKINDTFIIKLHGYEKAEIHGLVLQKPTYTLLVWETYNTKIATEMTRKLELSLNSQHTFEPYIFNQELFRNWIGISSQLIECGFTSPTIGEQKISAFDLKKSKQFLDTLNKTEIQMLSFTLEHQNVLITARKTGKLSITPDIDNKKLISILDILLTNGITMVANE